MLYDKTLSAKACIHTTLSWIKYHLVVSSNETNSSSSSSYSSSFRREWLLFFFRISCWGNIKHHHHEVRNRSCTYMANFSSLISRALEQLHQKGPWKVNHCQSFHDKLSIFLSFFIFVPTSTRLGPSLRLRVSKKTSIASIIIQSYARCTMAIMMVASS